MSNLYQEAHRQCETIIDFLRFGLTQANKNQLYYGHGTDNAWDEVLALVLGSLHLPFDVEPMIFQSRLTLSEKTMLLERFSKRFEDKVPVPYLTHEAYFCGLPFYVDERVLIPRSPIAELIKQEFSPWIEASEVVRVLDLCTGSACIAIACAHAFPDAKIDAVDISNEALEVAAINCQRHEVCDRVSLIQSDCWKNVPRVRYNLIVSNPPYVGFDEMDTLPVEYRHEPKLALEAGQDGLAIVEDILAKAQDYLAPNGLLVMEVGNSADALQEAFPHVPFTWLDFEQGGEGVFILTSEQVHTYFRST